MFSEDNITFVQKFTAGRCDDCEHSVMQHFCHFNKHILNPIKRSGYVSEGRRAMMKLKDQILDCILLRRTKSDRSNDIMLPGRFVKVRKEYLDEKEADFYDALYTKSKSQFNTYVAAGTILNNYAHIFDILIRLRQAVDHPYLVIYSDTIKDYNATNETDGADASYSKKMKKADDGNLQCGLCHEPAENPRKSKCGHLFCKDCALDLIENASNTAPISLSAGISSRKKKIESSGDCVCPVCLKPLTILSMEEDVELPDPPAFKTRKQSILSKIPLDKFQSSTKLEALVQVHSVKNTLD